jgi:hypothetical protein
MLRATLIGELPAGSGATAAVSHPASMRADRVSVSPMNPFESTAYFGAPKLKRNVPYHWRGGL